MKFLLTLSSFVVLVVMALAQPFGGFGGFGDGYSGFSGDFGGPSAFGSEPFSAPLTRDNRQNRGNQGPVVFPMSPSDAPVESSGVVIGASGFGFVPPGPQMLPFKKYARFKGPKKFFRYMGKIFSYHPIYYKKEQRDKLVVR
ncbi:CLUMA_CG008051, isoform A [Clunio marinus]|uniref:CLUMA_CG008051, isoform A n=1 Tax=Clunio marinus TaxID=568069 RepID=A0A1J1I2P1_9DIPT|nr:CLUMA_CG008051, isoform A [Clunio marinus]